MMFWEQPKALAEADADCFACVVNAISLCKRETLAADGVFATVTRNRALDLMNLPHLHTDEQEIAPLITAPIGEHQ